MCKLNKRQLLVILSLSLFSGMLLAAERGKTGGATTVVEKKVEAVYAEDSKPVRDPVAQMRGKLLYKRSQAKKLERIAIQNDAVLGEKISNLEGEIAALYSAANPKLAEIYAEQKQLTLEIENLTRKD
ncbi:MAG: hypothetical protein WCT05_08645 [Lentisphaeria bacterium]